jgi:7-cyano-7-deazaguanine synthase
VLFSGGQDSTTCLAWALERFAHVETLASTTASATASSWSAGLTVRDELVRAVPALGARLGEDHLLDLALLGQISDTALTDERAIELQANGLPNTFVPGRNLLFLTFAATWPTGAAPRCWWAACARPTTPATPTAATTPSRRCRWRCRSGWRHR